jgi:hypothetical protein
VDCKPRKRPTIAVTCHLYCNVARSVPASRRSSPKHRENRRQTGCAHPNHEHRPQNHRFDPIFVLTVSRQSHRVPASQGLGSLPCRARE